MDSHALFGAHTVNFLAATVAEEHLKALRAGRQLSRDREIWCIQFVSQSSLQWLVVVMATTSVFVTPSKLQDAVLKTLI